MEKTGVPKKNPYVFGVRGINENDSKYLRACNLLRKFSEDCGAECPERLRGTKLRKHIATKCITLNLEQEEVSDLANFMGHAEKIHKDKYRQPLLSREILRISKLLEVVQGEVSDENESDNEESQTDNFQAIEQRNKLSKEDEQTCSLDNYCRKYSARKRSNSVIYVSNPGEIDIPIGEFVGDMTDELEKEGPGSYITGFVSEEPKNYSYTFWSTKDREHKTVCKVKKISLNYSSEQLVNSDTIKDCELLYIINKQFRQTQTHEGVTLECNKKYEPRQIKNVLGSRRNDISAQSLKASELWYSFAKLQLIENMRVADRYFLGPNSMYCSQMSDSLMEKRIASKFSVKLGGGGGKGVATAEHLFNVFMESFRKKKMPISNIVGFVSDGYNTIPSLAVLGMNVQE
ncbi:hypothetical protein JTB14_011708 [Gonioctena quinquepunctata]|nr:hypothetical protein JTB14_011708 [Gonioctena quinquepunctata]